MLLLPLLLSCIVSTNPNSQLLRLLRPCASVLSIGMQDLARNPFTLGQPKLKQCGAVHTVLLMGWRYLSVQFLS